MRRPRRNHSAAFKAKAVLDSKFDPATVVIADTSDVRFPSAQLQSLPAPTPVKARVTSFEPGAIDVALDQPTVAGQGLVVSENYFPGWHATVDGKDVPTGLANYNLIGVALPAGARTIQLRYVDAAYEKGRVLTLAALLVSLCMTAWGRVQTRRLEMES